MTARVLGARCRTYDRSAIENAVRAVITAAGGIDRFVRPGERILLKPNLLSAREPFRGVTTHPEVVRAVALLVRSAGAVPVIGDSPGGAIKGVDRVWERTGMRALADAEGIELVNFETAGSESFPTGIPAAPDLQISRAALSADGIINLPKLKTHSLMALTAGVKNLFGCIPGLMKGDFHKKLPLPRDFAVLLASLYRILRPRVRLTLVDAVVAMEGNGPGSGDLISTGFICACEDALALDTALAAALGADPGTLLVSAACTGLGESDPSRIVWEGDKPELPGGSFRFPPTWHFGLVPGFLLRALGKLIWMKPFIAPDRCVNCQECVRACPVKAINPGPGKPMVRAKDCISCLCCHELCPHRSIDLKPSLLARLFFRT